MGWGDLGGGDVREWRRGIVEEIKGLQTVRPKYADFENFNKALLISA
jgi:hypothetical protein